VWSHVYNDGERQVVVDKLAAAGLRWVRIDIGWASMERDGKGQITASYIDLLERCVNMARQRNLQVLVNVSGTPGWANGNRASSTPPTNPAAYGDFARWIAGRLRGRVSAWEIWNEPNSPGFWAGTVAEYAELVKAGYRGFKAGDSGASVVAGGSAWNDSDWVRELYQRGVKDHFDALSTHPYQGVGDAPPEHADDGNKWWFSHAPAVRQVMVDYGDADAQLWFTEFGWSTHSNDGIPAGSDNSWMRGVTEATQADYVVRSIEHARRNWPYVGPMFWYKERSWRPAGSTWFDTHFEGYGLLRPDGSVRPAYSALKRLLTGR